MSGGLKLSCFFDFDKSAKGQSEKIQHVSDGGCFLRKQPWRPLPHMKPKTWERYGLKSWIRAEASAPQRAGDRARRGPAFALTLLFNGAALASGMGWPRFLQ